MMLKTKVALFDCDKTLVEITDIANKALSEALWKNFKVRGDMTLLKRNAYCGVSMTQIIIDVMELAYKKANKVFVPEDVTFRRFLACKQEYESGLARRIRAEKNPNRYLCENVEKFFRELRSADIPIGVYTGGPEEVCRAVLRATEIRRYVTAITSASNRVRAIESCVGMLEEKYKHDFKPAEVAVFGDSLNDMKAAIEAGSIPIGVLHASKYTSRELKKAGAKKVYAGFVNYRLILKEIFGLYRK